MEILKRHWPWYVWAGIAAVIIVVVLPLAGLIVTRTGMSSGAAMSLRMVKNSEEAGLSAPMMGEVYATQGVAMDADIYGGDGTAMKYTYNTRMMPTPAPSAGATAAEVDQKIIKTADLNLQVEDVPAATKRTTELATERGGFVQSSSVSENPNGSKNGYVTVRVPAEKFEDLVSAIRSLALVVRNESVSGQDMTEQYTDLAARLKNAKAQEATYLAVLEKAKTVEDILKVQSYLGSIRETIERYEGQLKYLENRTSYSTVSVSLSEEPSVPLPGKTFRPGTSFQEAWRTLVALFQDGAIFIIWLIIVGGGLLLPLALIAWLVVWIVRRRRNRQ